MGHHLWLSLDTLKTVVSTLYVHFIWVVLIFTLCHSHCQLLESLILLGGNVRKRSCGIRGHSHPLECSHVKCPIGHILSDPGEQLVAHNCVLVHLASLFLTICFPSPVNTQQLDLLHCLLLAFHRCHSNSQLEEIIGV
jgi:hypothetical protein